ncbi:uncharacterized protein EV420DRAFT_92782 [Desarmillaria tabescens]|uniref:Uncharacterized protein n=1 Tax=Armillaria tabescens TaxID=1929756 RepID=A0AA39NRF8_ARMTA|nr:uncharacterized protein EV420DRAFT_92782 [Desarmillaria tabescens]KAK0470153.1 hypothetical protein EV420DRAFT_92782 [Desarmillaria tabescens]
MSPLDLLILDAAEWPAEMQCLAGSLDYLIPSQLACGSQSCPSVSSRTSPIFQELATLYKRSPGQFSQSDAHSEVLDILDLLIIPLVSVGYEDYYARSSDCWTTIIAHHSIMEDVYASLLISHTVEDIQPPRPTVESNVPTLTFDNTEDHSDGKFKYEEYHSHTLYEMIPATSIWRLLRRVKHRFNHLVLFLMRACPPILAVSAFRCSFIPFAAGEEHYEQQFVFESP